MRYTLDNPTRKKLSERFDSVTIEALERTVDLVNQHCEMEAMSNPKTRPEIKKLIEDLLEKIDQDFFSRQYANYQDVQKTLKRFHHTMTAACDYLQEPKRGPKQDPKWVTHALNIGRCLAENGVDLRNYDGESQGRHRSGRPRHRGGDFVFAVHAIFKTLGYTIALASTRRYVAKAIDHLQWKEDFMSRVPAIQRDRFNSIRDRLPKTRRGQNTRKVEHQVRAKILSRQ